MGAGDDDQRAAGVLDAQIQRASEGEFFGRDMEDMDGEGSAELAGKLHGAVAGA